MYDICLCFSDLLFSVWAFLVAHVVKNLPAVQETWVQFLGREDPLEKGTATRCTILAWTIPRQRSLVGYSQQDGKERDMTEQLTLSLCIIGSRFIDLIRTE